MNKLIIQRSILRIWTFSVQNQCKRTLNIKNFPNGVDFNVQYIDTSPGRLDLPVALAIHGAPGTHKDFLPIVDQLAERGYRVIIPNFPGYGLTTGHYDMDEQVFSHSVTERLLFIADFVALLGVFKIDLVLGHGMGTHVASGFCARHPGVRSALFLAPAPHELHRGLPPSIMMRFFARKWQAKSYIIKPFLWLMFTFMHAWLRYEPTSHRAKHIGNMVLSGNGTHYPDIISFALEMEIKQLPLVSITSEDDLLVMQSQLTKYHDLLGIKADAREEYDKDGVCLKSVVPSENTPHHAKSILLQNGTSFPQKTYTDLVIKEALELLEKSKNYQPPNSNIDS
ncbi:unnamed protein product [Owenia fusiformis]|uniref:Uncharacterized protein n=1 Tax=Owenia fusiformis TaxID=6347 RepID=A0A8J1YD55_OWEFU|nr:unnamed protein product [Owenia fusiformis]